MLKKTSTHCLHIKLVDRVVHMLGEDNGRKGSVDRSLKRVYSGGVGSERLGVRVVCSTWKWTS